MLWLCDKTSLLSELINLVFLPFLLYTQHIIFKYNGNEVITWVVKELFKQ